MSGGYQPTENNFADGRVRTANAEDGRFGTSYRVKSAPSTEFAGGVRLWKQFGLRAGVGRLAVSTPATLTGSVPHPFFFGRQRSVGGAIDGLNREELAISLHAAGTFAIPPES